MTLMLLVAHNMSGFVTREGVIVRKVILAISLALVCSMGVAKDDGGLISQPLSGDGSCVDDALTTLGATGATALACVACFRGFNVGNSCTMCFAQTTITYAALNTALSSCGLSSSGGSGAGTGSGHDVTSLGDGMCLAQVNGTRSWNICGSVDGVEQCIVGEISFTETVMIPC